MKTNGFLCLTFALCLLTAGYGCKKKGFEPTDRTTVKMSQHQKDSALNVLKGRGGVDIDSMLLAQNVKMSVLPPSSKELSESQTEALAFKMLQMLAKNGIGGVNNVPGFAFTASISPATIQTVNTTPQKYLVEYDVNFSVINTATGDVYATAVRKIQGVGASFEQATDNAINVLSADAKSDMMLAEASRKIIDWYENNLSTFKAQVADAESKKDYALALALIQSAPQQAESAFAYAESRRTDIENKFMQQISHNELTALKQAVMESDNEPSAQVYAHYRMISPDSKSYQEAQAVLKKYEQDVETKRARESAQNQANLEAERQQQMELARMEESRIKAKYEAQASEQAIRLYLSQNSAGGGFWKNLGARIIGAIDGTNWQYRVKDKPYTDD